MPIAQGDGQLLWLLSRRRRHELSPWFDECLNLCLAKSAAIDANFVDLASKLLSLLDSADVQINFGIVEVRCTDVSFRDRITIDVELRFPLPLASHDRCDVLPRVGSQRPRRRLHGAVRLIVRPRCFDPQDPLIVGHVQVPTVSPTVFPQANDSCLAKLRRMNPRRDSELAVADVHRFVTRDNNRIVFAVERHPLSKWRINELHIARQSTILEARTVRQRIVRRAAGRNGVSV